MHCIQKGFALSLCNVAEWFDVVGQTFQDMKYHCFQFLTHSRFIFLYYFSRIITAFTIGEEQNPYVKSDETEHIGESNQHNMNIMPTLRSVLLQHS